MHTFINMLRSDRLVLQNKGQFSVKYAINIEKLHEIKRSKHKKTAIPCSYVCIRYNRRFHAPSYSINANHQITSISCTECAVNINLVIYASPGAPGIGCDTYIMGSIIGYFIRCSTATRFVYKSCFCTDNITMSILVFNSTQKPVGNLKTFWMFCCWRGQICPCI